MNETKTVKHRDGTTDKWRAVTVPMDDLARRVAIWLRVVRPGASADEVKWSLTQKNRGFLNPDGTPAKATYLAVERADGKGPRATVTKTGLGPMFRYIDRKTGRYYHIGVEELSASGAKFREKDGDANCWILGDVFCA